MLSRHRINAKSNDGDFANFVLAWIKAKQSTYLIIYISKHRRRVLTYSEDLRATGAQFLNAAPSTFGPTSAAALLLARSCISNRVIWACCSYSIDAEVEPFILLSRSS